MKSLALGIVVKDKPDLTALLLQSIYLSQEPKSNYEVFVIDNASNDETRELLKESIQTNLLPYKNIYFVKNEYSLSRIWNLFLCISQQYAYRMCMNNDVVLAHTLPPSTKKKKSPIEESSPAQADPLAGAPRSSSIVGAGSAALTPVAPILKQSRKSQRNSSQFFTLMKNFSAEYNVDIVSLVPVIENENFRISWNRHIAYTLNNLPYIVGGCMLITKKAFDTLGYFDERLAENIDIEYTHRAIKQGINIGYHPEFWIISRGTQTAIDRHKKDQALNIILNSPLRGKNESDWDKIIWKILSTSKKRKIIQLK